MPRKREYPDRPIVGVGGVVIEHARTVLIRRSNPPLEGQWSIPGGILEVSETILQGVERELHEETGLVVRAGELIEVFERIIPDKHGRTQYHFVIIDYLCERLSGSPRPGGDALEAVWVEQGDLERYALVPAVIRVLGKAFELARLRDSLPR
ncbi:MAG: NUDIX hydrolase [Candidatus Acidiferrales bacterium]